MFTLQPHRLLSLSHPKMLTIPSSNTICETLTPGKADKRSGCSRAHMHRYTRQKNNHTVTRGTDYSLPDGRNMKPSSHTESTQLGAPQWTQRSGCTDGLKGCEDAFVSDCKSSFQKYAESRVATGWKEINKEKFLNLLWSELLWSPEPWEPRLIKDVFAPAGDAPAHRIPLELLCTYHLLK